MKTLRLICTYKCNRNCEGCCNKQDSFVSDNIQVWDGHYEDYDQIILTGGEPLLFPLSTIWKALEIGFINRDAKIIVYTAKAYEWDIIANLLKYIDGITITIHEQSDVDDFNRLNFWLLSRKRWIRDNNKTLRLNVFKGVDVYMQDDSLWKIKDNIEWIMDCPLPASEDLRKLKHMW